MNRRTWTEAQLKAAVAAATSYRQVLSKLKLREAGGNYAQLKKYVAQFDLDTRHFTGRAWNKGLRVNGVPRIPLEKVLVKNSSFQSFKLKQRLFSARLKPMRCEDCGWAKTAPDGRLPLELHHINGDSRDNRLENLRILCPNCHSLKPTHRGRNSGKKARVL
jgi:Zn finger protein HypA/HybF involved in hydrogenase expression